MSFSQFCNLIVPPFIVSGLFPYNKLFLSQLLSGSHFTLVHYDLTLLLLALSHSVILLLLVFPHIAGMML